MNKLGTNSIIDNTTGYVWNDVYLYNTDLYSPNAVCVAMTVLLQEQFAAISSQNSPTTSKTSTKAKKIKKQKELFRTMMT